MDSLRRLVLVLGVAMVAIGGCFAFLAPNLWYFAAICLAPLAILGQLWHACVEREAGWQERQQQAEAAAATAAAALEEEKETHRSQALQIKQEMKAEKEHFRRALAHQLRMPLSIIQGYAQLLEREVIKDPEQQRDYLHKIVEKTYGINQIISQQFSQNRLEDTRSPNFQERDVVAMLQQYSQDISVVSRTHGIEVRVLSVQDSYLMEIDEGMFRRVMHNLFENAIKYMGRPGNIIIYTDLQEDYLSVSVRDDGMGLSPEETLHIFDANYQGKNHKNGSGTGLYMVRLSVEAQGGVVYANSQIGKGMTIRMLFPRYQHRPLTQEQKEEFLSRPSSLPME